MENGPVIANATLSKKLSRMRGLSLHFWEDLMIFALAVVGVFGVIVGVATFAVVRLQRAELAASKLEFDRYKEEAATEVEAAKADAARANESAAKLNNETARLHADNLALQTVLLPRHAGLFGINGPAPAAEWFKAIAPFAGTKLLIQVANDKEAGNLSSEIGIIVTKFGWTAQLVDEKRTHLNSDQIRDGVSVAYPVGKQWSPENQSEPWFNWAKATEALADALTKAGLAVGERRVSRYGIMPNSRPTVIGLEPNFDPPLDGVFLQVGARPVAETVEWIKQGRQDVLGNPPQNVGPDKTK